MLPPIQIPIESNAGEVLRQLEAFPETMKTRIARALDLENELTVGHIVAKKLSRRGPRTLGVVTNRLRPSVRRTDAVVTDKTIESAIGTNVIYAGAHEFGFVGVVTVREHRARNRQVDLFQVGDQVLPRWRALSETRRKKKIASGIVTVRAHRRSMNIPARAPIRTGISERVPSYTRSISAAILEAWEGRSA